MTGELTAAEAKKRAEDAENKSDIYFLMTIMGMMILLIASTMTFVAWLFGARFDLVFKEIMSGNFKVPASTIGHDEL